MGFFQEYETGIETYVRDHVVLEIVDIELASPAGVLSIGDVAWFNVEIHNTGPLDMADVTVRIRGRNGTKVRNADVTADWANQFTTTTDQFPLVPGHNDGTRTATTADNGGRFSFLAPSTPQPRRVLVDAVIEGWSPELASLHRHHSRTGRSDHVIARHEDAVRPNRH